MKLEAKTRLEERPRHPGGSEPEQTAGSGEFRMNLIKGFGIDGFEMRANIHGYWFFWF